MDRIHYTTEALRQLSDTNFYQQLDQPIAPDSCREIHRILDHLHRNKFIPKDILRLLKGNPPYATRKFYLLPKIHKEKSKWTVPDKMPPGRPIVSDCSSESYGVAAYIDYFLKPIANKHQSYLKDTFDFLEKIGQQTFFNPCFLFTMDVEGLYTNIDTQLGLAAVRRAFERHPDPNRPDEELLELLRISLTQNDFTFDQKMYLQTKGTAMGKRFAPSYADIYMADWETTALQNVPKLPTAYFRYLDDIWGVWNHSLEEFQIFVQSLNNCHPNIKLTPEIHENQTHFLDVTIFKDDTFDQTHTFQTKVYFKPTDSRLLLHFHSSHPRHIFKGIFQAQLLRYKRICTRFEDWKQAASSLTLILKQRDYPPAWLRHHLRHFIKKHFPPMNISTRKRGNRTTIHDPTDGSNPTQTTNNPLLREQESATNDDLLSEGTSPHTKQVEDQMDHQNLAPFISPFNQTNKILSTRIQRNTRETLQPHSFFDNLRPIKAYSIENNLRRILVKARLPPRLTSTTTTPGPKPRIPFKKTNWTFAIKDTTHKHTYRKTTVPLDTENLVYYIRCRKCGSIYVGETRHSLRTRRIQHLSSFRSNARKTDLTRHFRRHGSLAAEFGSLQHDPSWNKPERLMMERIWKRRLKANLRGTWLHQHH